MNNTATNDTTGDMIQTKPSNDGYRSGWDRVFGESSESKPSPCSDEDAHTDVVRGKGEPYAYDPAGRVTGAAGHQHPPYKKATAQMINLG